MDSTAQPMPGHWSALPRAYPAAECLSRRHQAYLVRRDIILTYAVEVLGSRDLAVQWFTKPAGGLDYRPPCRVIADDQGFHLVNDYLCRIEYGVY